MIRILKTNLFSSESCFGRRRWRNFLSFSESVQLFRLSLDNERFKLNLPTCHTETLDSIFGTLAIFVVANGKIPNNDLAQARTSFFLPFKTCLQNFNKLFVCLVYVTDSKVCLPKWNSTLQSMRWLLRLAETLIGVSCSAFRYITLKCWFIAVAILFQVELCQKP